MKKLFRPTVPLESYQHVKPPPLALVEVTVTHTDMVKIYHHR